MAVGHDLVARIEGGEGVNGRMNGVVKEPCGREDNGPILTRRGVGVSRTAPGEAWCDFQVGVARKVVEAVGRCNRNGEPAALTHFSRPCLRPVQGFTGPLIGSTGDVLGRYSRQGDGRFCFAGLNPLIGDALHPHPAFSKKRLVLVQVVRPERIGPVVNASLA